MTLKVNLNDEQRQLFRATAGLDPANAEARQAFAQLFGPMLLKTVPANSTVREIFNYVDMSSATEMKFPIDPNDVLAYYVAKIGSFQRQTIEGDYITLSPFAINQQTNWSLDYAKDAGYNVVDIALMKLNDAIVRLEEENGWGVLRKAANNAYANGFTGQRIEIADGSTGAGVFSKQLINSMAAYFEARGKKMTHLYGPAGTMMKDIRNWTETNIDPVTQREIFVGGGLGSIWGTQIVPMPLLRYSLTMADKKAFTETTLDRLFNVNDTTDAGASVWSEAIQAKYAAGNYEVCYGVAAGDVGIFAQRDQITTVDDPTAVKYWEQGVLARERVAIAVTGPRDIVMGIVDRTSDETA